MTTFIYILIDPITKEIRYVGKSNNPLDRYKNHKNDCRDKNTHKRNWIKSLKNKNSKPLIEIVDEVEISDWIWWERFWISYYKFIGCNLTNYTVGGDGLTFGNSTSFKSGNIPWNKGLGRIKIKKGFNIKCLETCFKKGDRSWIKGVKGVKLKPDKNVHQYTLDGCFVKTWRTAKEASDELNLSQAAIGQCARQKSKSSGGFLWSYMKFE